MKNNIPEMTEVHSVTDTVVGLLQDYTRMGLMCRVLHNLEV